MTHVVLDAYAARSCPVKTFNSFDPTISKPQLPLDESLRESFQGGSDYRKQVLDLLVSAGATELRTPAEQPVDWETRVQLSLAAMAAGDQVIVGAALPIDAAGHRSGRPDALIRGEDTPSGGPGYWPLKVKPYRVREKQIGATTLRSSALENVGAHALLPDWRYRNFREGVLLELAHHWRLLEACGFASTTELAAIVGDDRTAHTPPEATWVSLSEKFIRTYSKSAGHKLRSPLERYDHEHKFRVYVAQQAELRTGSEDPEPVVRPIRVKECDWCAWWEVCRQQIDDDDLSLRISKAPLDVRELQTLLSLGIKTVAELANADVDELLPAYLPLTAHRDRAEQRLRQAARRARMLAEGVDLERVSVDPIAVPRAEVEIDLDIETSDDGNVYLWGALLTDEQGTTFHEFSRFKHLSHCEEFQLAEEFAQWLLAQIELHPGLRVYHYSDYETVHLQRLAQRSGLSGLKAVCAVLKEHFVDLFGYIRDNFVGVDGLGLKVVATRGAGFSWRDEEPGGLASQSWFNEAIDAPQDTQRAAARERVLQYNEDDVRATLAVRNWLTRLDAN